MRGRVQVVVEGIGGLLCPLDKDQVHIVDIAIIQV